MSASERFADDDGLLAPRADRREHDGHADSVLDAIEIGTHGRRDLRRGARLPQVDADLWIAPSFYRLQNRSRSIEVIS